MAEQNITTPKTTIKITIDETGGCDMAFNGTAMQIVTALEAAMASVLLRLQYPPDCTAEAFAEIIPCEIKRHMIEMKKQEEAAEQCQQSQTAPVR